MSDGQNHHASGSPTPETRFTDEEPPHCRADRHDDRGGRRNCRGSADHHADADTKYQHHNGSGAVNHDNRTGLVPRSTGRAEHHDSGRNAGIL